MNMTFENTIKLTKKFFYRQFCSNVCARCQVSIESNALILRINQMIFHVECFACIKCNLILNPGKIYHQLK